MAAETGVCKVAPEVAGNLGVSGLDTCSTHDPDPNGIGNEDQASYPDHSYVFVIGADANSDDSLEINVVASADVTSVLESKSSVQHFGANMDVDEHLMGGKNGTTEASDGYPLEINGLSAETEISPFGGVGLLDENNLKTNCRLKLDAPNGTLDFDNGGFNKPLKEGGIENVERTCRKPSMVNDDTLKQESLFVDEDGIQDQIEDHFMETDCVAEAKTKQDGDPKGKITTSELVLAEKSNDQNEKTENVADTELKKVEEQIISESSSGLEKNRESEVPKLGLFSKSGEEANTNNKLSPLNIPLQTKDACEREIILRSTETSQVSAEDVADCHLQDVCAEENEINFTLKIMEAVKGEVSQTTFLNPGLERYQIDDKMETQSALGAAGDDMKWSIVPGDTVECSSDKEKEEAINMDCSFGTVCGQVSKGTSKEFSVSHVENSIQYPKDSGELSYSNKVTQESTASDNETKAPVLSRSFSASSGEFNASLTEVKCSDAENFVIASCSSVDGANSHTVENEPFCLNSQEVYTVISTSSGCDSTLQTVTCIEKEPTFKDGNAHAGADVSLWKSEDGTDPYTYTDQELEPECHDFSALGKIDSSNHVTVTSRVVVLDDFVVDEEVCANIMLESAEVNNVGEQFSGVMGSKAGTLLFQGNKDTGILLNENISKASSKGSSTDAITGENASVDAVPKPFNFLIRIPRFHDEKLKEQLKAAKLEVNEKTKLRDAIQAEIQKKRVNNQIHGIDYEYAKGESRSLRKLLALKRMEISSLQSIINKAKNAISIEDMNSRINNMEHMIQHETLPLREEKELIRDIKQLKQFREQLSCNMGSQSEIQQALDQREDAEERVKILRKELAILKDRMSVAQTMIMEVENKFDDENKKIKELQAQFRAADDIRQAAYARWQNLREQLSQKNKYFVEYKDDEVTATNCAFNGDREALHHLCMNQVEKFMELWNGNGEFRSEYTGFNARSTLRRLGSLDGRSLGPDEKPPNLPIYDNKERNDNVDCISRHSLELEQQMSTENVALDVQSIKMVKESKEQIVTTKGPANHQLGSDSGYFSGKEITDVMQEEDSVKTSKEVELARKEEEIRRDEAEAKKKEELRLEQLAKAKEAREKKKRHDEKMQMREEMRARKEAELKEKEKEKKMRKKERKKAASASTDVNDSSETGESTMDVVKEEIQLSDNSSCATTKRTNKTSIASKQSKTKSLPPALRNRNKRKWQQWMWVSLTSVVVILVFWLGNMGFFANVNLKRHSPAY
ncbi:microtubule-associated protein futsch [Dorcoceras hygrometricum]|uniref:Microtubule-associated protein futsch n=1 Tax=Dorcoceras hygrometricum TaxID=472368 RepID=A0A2Z7C8A6_9LAMI|nr:microtubule-associated protein futsch [Dorcoceras hygrometricum]